MVKRNSICLRVIDVREFKVRLDNTHGAVARWLCKRVDLCRLFTQCEETTNNTNGAAQVWGRLPAAGSAGPRAISWTSLELYTEVRSRRALALTVAIYVASRGSSFELFAVPFLASLILAVNCYVVIL